MELLLTVEQAAERLHLQPNTVRLHLSRGLLRGVKRGRQWRIPETALTEEVSAKGRENQQSLARALELVAQLETKMKSQAREPRAIFDAAAAVREVREARTT